MVGLLRMELDEPISYDDTRGADFTNESGPGEDSICAERDGAVEYWRSFDAGGRAMGSM